MRAKRALAAGAAAAMALSVYAACGDGNGDAGPGASASDATSPLPDTSVTDAADPRCNVEAVLLGTHPHASAQPTDLGRTISDVRGFGRALYFAYGDLEANTGPIYITSFDPKKAAWTDHPVAYTETGTGVTKTTPTFGTHDIERFLVVAGKLWAPAAQPFYGAPFDSSSAPEFAVGTTTHDWSQVDISPTGIHVIDAIERAPGDVYVTGSALMRTDASAAANGRSGGHIWRSQDGGPFEVLYPDFARSVGGAEYFDLLGGFVFGAALNGTAYFDVSGYIYKWDGGAWDGWEAFGEFLTPSVFAGRIVFGSTGQLFAFDGQKRTNLGFRSFESPGRYQGSKEPIMPFQVTEGHLIAAAFDGHLMETTDLTSWHCIGKVPADTSAVGSLDGVVYFGTTKSQVYGLPSASW